MEKEFSIRESLKASWRLIKGENLFLLIGLFLGYLTLIWLFKMLEMVATGVPLVNLLLSISEILIGLIFSLGMIRLLLQIVEGEEPKFNSFTKIIPLIPRYIGASIIKALPAILPVIVGVIALFLTRGFFQSFQSLNTADANAIAEWLRNSNVPKLVAYQILIALFVASLPLIYLSVRWMFYVYLIVDKKVGVIESLRRSWELTRGNFWHLVLYFITVIILIILGLFAFLIGVLVVIPLVALATVLIYKKLESQMEIED